MLRMTDMDLTPLCVSCFFTLYLHLILIINKHNITTTTTTYVFYINDKNKPQWQEETEGYLRLMEEREIELMDLPGGDERWENWMQYTQSRMVPKFTELGFAVIDTPKEVHEKLYKKVMDAVADYDNIPEETDVQAIYGDKRPVFVNMEGEDWNALKSLHELHEQWAGGIELVGTSAYGVRLYQNGSSLVMHYDKIKTHVISSIVHIAHQYDDDNNPWPIQIEDHNGELHSVNLEPGQMLFYESAKCLHGRMKEFRGKYYGSIFLHYAPVDKSIWNFTNEDVIANVPPHWNEDLLEDKGSRWAGQGITVDSRAAAGVPPRIINGEFIHDRKSPHAGVDSSETFDAEL